MSWYHERAGLKGPRWERLRRRILDLDVAVVNHWPPLFSAYPQLTTAYRSLHSLVKPFRGALSWIESEHTLFLVGIHVGNSERWAIFGGYPGT